MPGAFYRNTSSGGKKSSERERRQSSSLTRSEGREADSRPVQASPAPVVEEKTRGGVGWTARITPSVLVTASILSLLLLSFSFLSGVIVGRGTLPVPPTSELQPLLPAEQEGASGEEEKTGPEPILPKEDLSFMSSLKSEQGAGVLSDRDKPETKAQPEPVQEKPNVEPSEPKEPEIDYVLRVAAFKKAEPAQELRKKLAKDGLRAKYTQTKTKKGTWHYVLVQLRGTDADFQETRSLLKASGLGDFMILSKTPVKK